MGCWASKMAKMEILEEKMEHDDSMYVYYNPLHYSPEDRLADSRQKAALGPAGHTQQPLQENCELATKQLHHKDHEAVGFVSPDHKEDDKNNNVVVNGVTGPNMIASLSSDDIPRPTKADEAVAFESESCIIEKPPAEHSEMIIVQEKGIELNPNNDQRRESDDQQLGLSEEEENNLHPRSPSLENHCRDSGVVGSGETAENDGDWEDGEMRMKKLDIINDGEKEDLVDTCSEIILPTHHHPLREIACKNPPNNNQLPPRSSISSLKKSRMKLRQSRISGPRKSSGSVKSLIDGRAASRPSLSPTRRRSSCSHSSDILVTKYSLQV